MRAGIEKIIASAIQAAIECGELSLEEMPDPSVERPKDIEHGDWASSVAMKLAKPARMNPRKIAEIICSHISDDEMIESTEIAGPGFINFKLKSSAFQAVIMKARVEGADFGRVNIGDHKRIQVEFVSANPTGPMHVGHGRWAALGNSLCNILDHAGWDVSREFYINDAGSQMDNFANSVDARYQQLCGIDAELPENGYGGSYVTAIAQRILDSEGEKWASSSSEERSAAFKEIAYKMMLDNMCELLASIGVEFDVWFSERSLYAKDEGGKSAIEKTLDELGAGGYLFEKDGAIWFRSTDFGDDKDRVLVK
ncbi:MAG: arginine--tRNA ligase, partial [Coriobacteriales bacterium]|nr:arginine--tRNA ligase [Coriobacteriales bacterium]